MKFTKFMKEQTLQVQLVGVDTLISIYSSEDGLPTTAPVTSCAQ